MGHYVISAAEGDLYGCSDKCAADVFQIIAARPAAMVAMRWTTADRDAFCASCAMPIGWRRRSARLLHEAMDEISWAIYDALGEAECCDL